MQMEHIYKPGLVNASKGSDKWLQRTEEGPPKHLLFCKNKERIQILNTINHILGALAEFDPVQAEIMVDTLIDDYYEHYDQAPMKSYTIKQISRRILNRVSKYELCDYLTYLKEAFKFEVTTEH